jgi:CRISPR/Cas system-associated protein Cas10 (large subunit of type III CRISPR-Cas system)
VRRAEHAAKRRYGRNALAVEVLKRSGETVTVGTKWSYDKTPDVVDLLIELVRRLEKEQISGKWPYVVQAEAWTLEELSSDAQRAELSACSSDKRARSSVKRRRRLRQKSFRKSSSSGQAGQPGRIRIPANPTA